jgi:NTP pyrophosphatase (non-canonical NTP hydrolase)
MPAARTDDCLFATVGGPGGEREDTAGCRLITWLHLQFKPRPLTPVPWLRRRNRKENQLELREYQEIAQETDQLPRDDPNGLVLPLLGMAGEVGSLLQEYKKRLRDGEAHQLHAEHLIDELGDILWYLANTASKFDLDLEEIARLNIEKTRDRWPPAGSEPPYVLFDQALDVAEQLPREFVATFTETLEDGGKSRMTLAINGAPAGDSLRDNAYDDDGYRFHDVFHLAHAALLGWSPVLRGKLLNPSKKRKSLPATDDVDDGGRAIVIDEAVVAYVWGYANQHLFLEGIETVDYPVLKTIKQLTSGLEVTQRTAHQWEEAILAGYSVWRELRRRGGGSVKVDLNERSIRLVA